MNGYTPHERPAARWRNFERCTCISFVYTAFQEADRVVIVDDHGRFLRREAEGVSFWGCGAMSDPLKVFRIKYSL